MAPNPEISQFTTEQLLSTCPVPLPTVTEAYAALMAMLRGEAVDPQRVQRAATALLAVITTAQPPPEAG
jgi:hypothetical protein